MNNSIKYALTAAIVISANFAHSYDDKDHGLFTLAYKRPPKTTSQQSAPTQSRLDISCAVEIQPIIDSRHNKETIGSTFTRALRATGVDAWLQDVKTTSLDSALNADANGTKRIVVKPELTRLYSYSKAMNIFGVAALNVNYEIDGLASEAKDIRGYHTKLNWADGLGEYQTSVNKSIESAASKLIEDISVLCDGDKEPIKALTTP